MQGKSRNNIRTFRGFGRVHNPGKTPHQWADGLDVKDIHPQRVAALAALQIYWYHGVFGRPPRIPCSFTVPHSEATRNAGGGVSRLCDSYCIFVWIVHIHFMKPLADTYGKYVQCIVVFVWRSLAETYGKHFVYLLYLCILRMNFDNHSQNQKIRKCGTDIWKSLINFTATF